MPAQAQAARHFLLGRIGVAQARRHGQEDERVDGQGHDEDGRPEASEGGKDGAPPEADHEVGNAERDHHQHGPETPARQSGALDEPGRHRPDDRAQGGDHHGQAHGVPDQLGRQPPEEERVQGAPSHLDGLGDEEDEGQDDRDVATSAPRSRRRGRRRCRGADGARGVPGQTRRRPRPDRGTFARRSGDSRGHRRRHKSCASWRSLIASAPVPSWAIVIGVGLELVERASRRSAARPRRSGTPSSGCDR